jgi:hypothetical protein
MSRINPTAAMKKKLQKEINSQCPFCGIQDVEIFEFHHLDRDNSNTTFDNLIMLCPTCHAKIEKGIILKDNVFAIKNSLQKLTKENIKTKATIDNSILQNSVIGNNNNVTINVKNIKEKKHKSVKPKYPEGAYGNDVIMYGYAKYLADRYIEYKNYELKQKKQEMNYGMFYGKVKKDFKAGGFFHIPQTRFLELVDYLHERINRTILAKINKNKGITKNYDSFEEYKELQQGNNDNIQN